MPDEAGSGNWFEPAPKVGAGWLLLRRPELGDAGALYDAVRASADHLRPWMPWATDYTRQSAQDFVERNALDAGDRSVLDAPYLVWSLHEELLGVCGLHGRIGPGALEIGYWVDVRRTRQGVATLTAAALSDFALNAPGVRLVEIRHDRANQASGAVAARLGYELVATVESEPAAPGEVGVENQWRMTSSGWPTSEGARLLRAAITAAS